MLPLNFHQRGLLTPKLLDSSVQYTYGSLGVGYVVIHLDVLEIDLGCRFVNTLPQHAHVKDIVNSRHLRWQSESVRDFSHTF